MISVIIPCYNCAATLPATLASLAAAGEELEVIAINDGSSDGTDAILSAHAANAPYRMVIYTKENGGVSAARNDGIAMAHGDYLMFLDADDLFAADLVPALSQFLQRTPTDTVAFRMTHDLQVLQGTHCKTASITATSPQVLLEAYTLSKRDMHFGGFVYRREILQRHGITFTVGARYGEDFEFLTKYLAHCETAAMLEAPAYFYRLTDGSVTATYTWAQTDAIDAALRAAAYLADIQHAYAAEFAAYMPARAAFSVAHRFAAAGERKLFDRLCREHDIASYMRRLIRYGGTDKRTRLAARLFLISPLAFRLLARSVG